MNQQFLSYFLGGGVVLGCAAVGLFFLRFYFKTHDRLFAIFAAAFWILDLNWLALALIERDEVRTWLYGVRLLAFLLILWGIIQKNFGTRNKTG